MKQIITLMFSFAALLMGAALQAQIPYCLTGVQVELSPIGTAEIFPWDIDAGSIDAATMSVSPNTFTCDDLGPVDVTLTVTDSNGNSDSCITTVYIIDNIPPVAICDQQVNVDMNADGIWEVDVNTIDDGSYDFCTPVTLSAGPSILECNGQSWTPVTLTVTDVYGNTSSCVTMVSYGLPDIPIPLACNDGQVVYIINEYPVEITADMLLEGSYIPCEELYDVTLTLNGNELPNNYVDANNIGDTIIAMITQLSSGNSCWGQLFIEQLVCDSFFVCDTECHSTDTGDCESGHTLDDNVEWPCDLTLPPVAEYPMPEYLLANGLADSLDATPTVTTEPCHLVGSSFADQVFIIGDDGYLIHRNWTVVEWTSAQDWEYEQIIQIEVVPLRICDTVAWSEPEGDCSGTGSSDDIEWPANDTIFSVATAPEDLALNPDVHPNNVEPVILNTIVPTDVTYSDEIVRVSDEHAIIQRVWTVEDLIGKKSYDYEQILHVFADLTVANVCVTNKYGLPVADVQFNPGESNSTGCGTIDVTPGLVIEPSKEDISTDGIDLLDVVLMREHILGITELTPLQLIAADVNMNGYVSTVDLALVQRLLDGTPYPGQSWRFFDNTGNPGNDFPEMANESITVGPIPEAYRFLGLKLGDIDFSVGQEPLGANSAVVDMHIMDEILNNGETYSPFIFAKELIAVQGLNMDIDLTSEKINIEEITSDVLPGFSSEEHIKVEQGKLLIRYTAPDEAMQSGDILVMPNEAILEFHITATGNGILSDEFRLVEDNPQFIKLRSSSEHVRVRLNWEQEIVSGTRDQMLTGVEVFPNPATDHVTVVHEPGARLKYSLFDMTGRTLDSGELGVQSIDLTGFNGGIYLLRLQDADGRQSIHKLILQR